ncbi:Myb/SANT-like domain-containing protein [Plasmodiophora brassicae]
MVGRDTGSANCKDGEKSKYLIRLLQKQADLGKCAGNTFKKEAWRAVHAKFITKLRLDYSLVQLKNLFDSVDYTPSLHVNVILITMLKTKYSQFRALLDYSGFG